MNYIKQIRHTLGDIALQYFRGKKIKYTLVDTSVIRATGVIVVIDKLGIEKLKMKLRKYGVDVISCNELTFREIEIPNPKPQYMTMHNPYDCDCIRCRAAYIPVPKLVFNHTDPNPKPQPQYYYLVLRKVELVDVD